MSRKTSRPSRSKTPTVLIVDDHEVVRKGLAQAIEDAPEFELAAEADGRRQALAACAEATPDLAIIDLSLEGDSGLELVKDLHVKYPRLGIMVLSMHDETLFAERSLRAGAKGYVEKSKGIAQVLDALRQILAGQIAISHRMASRLLERLTGSGPDDAASPIESLSDRELEVFELIGRGYGTQDIADCLRLSPRTVDGHREKIKHKLHVENAVELHQHAFLWVQQQGGGPGA